MKIIFVYKAPPNAMTLIVFVSCLIVCTSGQLASLFKDHDKGPSPEISVPRSGNSKLNIEITPGLKDAMIEYGITDDRLQKMYQQQMMTGVPVSVRRNVDGTEKAVTLDFNKLSTLPEMKVRKTNEYTSKPNRPAVKRSVVEKGIKIIPGKSIDKQKVVRVGETEILQESRIGPVEVVSRKVFEGPVLSDPREQLMDIETKNAKRLYENQQAALRWYQEQQYSENLRQYYTSVNRAAQRRDKIGSATARHVAKISQDLLSRPLPKLDSESDYKYIQQLMSFPANKGVGTLESGPGSEMQRLPGVVIGMGPTMPTFPNRFRVSRLKSGLELLRSPMTTPRVRHFNPYLRPRIALNNLHRMLPYNPNAWYMYRYPNYGRFNGSKRVF